jgi:hypothetical protein
MQLTFAARKVYLISCEDTLLLPYRGIAGDYESIGLVVVNKVASSYFQWSLMLAVD